MMNFSGARFIPESLRVVVGGARSIDWPTQEAPPHLCQSAGHDNERSTLVRADLHCHTWASDKPVNKWIGFLGVPECYSPPEKVYDQARTRGMDLVAITDHDTIAGAMELVERGFEDVIIGQEVTTFFPEDGCKLHVLVWGLTPELDEQITQLGLRRDVHDLAAWISQHHLPHALAHPLYSQNNKLTPEHLEKCALLFKGWEVLNGAHTVKHRATIERFLASLTPARVQKLERKHNIQARWTRVWHKARTGGSDDHGLLNVGRTWTGIAPQEDEPTRLSPDEFLRLVMSGRAVAGGVGGNESLLAHQLATVAAHGFADKFHSKLRPRARYASAKLLRIAGVDAPMPGKAALLIDTVRSSISRRRRGKSPLIDAVKRELGPVLGRYDDLSALLEPEAWTAMGSALSRHDRMASMADDLIGAVSRALGEGLLCAASAKDTKGVAQHALGGMLVGLAQAPYLFSLFHQNKERIMIDTMEASMERQRVESGGEPRQLTTRVLLFTDTLGDVNGVSRFIQNVALRAHKSQRDLHVFTSTRFEVPRQGNIRNFAPIIAGKMPKYEQLEAVLPPMLPMLRAAADFRPDVIHLSTPGAVGTVGWIAARMLRVPVVGVYHTDFPAYIDHLFDDETYTKLCRGVMRKFYKPFSRVFTRSDDYTNSLVELGVERNRVVRLRPGIDTARFSASHRRMDVWDDLVREGVPGATGSDTNEVRIVYCGRVSVEKNLPVLTKVWKRASAELSRRGVRARLIVVGDGPYRKTMEQELAGSGGAPVSFLGFRHGTQLSEIYASSDLFVFPSDTDTLGQVVMESQCAGLPVIVSDKGGPSEVVLRGETGFVIPTTDIGAWADKIVDLACDDEKRRAMGRAACKYMSDFDISHSFEHYWDVHRGVHAEASGRTRRNDSIAMGGVVAR
ncbi:MAG: glycosyltransferase [Phycisphaerales bacterium]|nr:glycosyltransferase [Phycisphaerales bacterium]